MPSDLAGFIPYFRLTLHQLSPPVSERTIFSRGQEPDSLQASGQQEPDSQLTSGHPLHPLLPSFVGFSNTHTFTFFFDSQSTERLALCNSPLNHTIIFLGFFISSPSFCILFYTVTHYPFSLLSPFSLSSQFSTLYQFPRLFGLLSLSLKFLHFSFISFRLLHAYIHLLGRLVFFHLRISLFSLYPFSQSLKSQFNFFSLFRLFVSYFLFP